MWRTTDPNVEKTEIVFVSPNYYEQTVVVKETIEQVDGLLGIWVVAGLTKI